MIAPEGELSSLLLEVLQLFWPVRATVRGSAVSDDWRTGVAYQQLGLAQNEQALKKNQWLRNLSKSSVWSQFLVKYGMVQFPHVK